MIHLARGIIGTLTTALILAIATNPVFGKDVGIAKFPNAGIEAVLTDEPCSDPSVQMLFALNGFAAALDVLKDVKVTWNGQPIPACIMEFDADTYFIIDAMGDGGIIPKDAFAPMSNPEQHPET